MNADHILQAHILDIVFENRNKEYGAYALRKTYNRRLYLSLSIMTLILALIIILLSRQQQRNVFSGTIFDGPTLRTVEIPDPPALPEPPAPKQKSVLPATPEKPAAPVLHAAADGNIIRFTNNALPVEIVPAAFTGNSNAASGDSSGNLWGKKGAGSIPSTDLVVNKPLVDVHTPANVAEVMPAFPGGMGALRKFLEKNLVNPAGLENGESVTVKIKFIVGYNGKLRGFEVLQDGGESFNNEVKRVLSIMPDWIPGRSRGENVSVYYVLPVKFIATD